jgi:hypothetical protein
MPETNSKHTKLCGRRKSPPDCFESIQIKSAADPATPLLMTPPKQDTINNMQFREVVGCFVNRSTLQCNMCDTLPIGSPSFWSTPTFHRAAVEQDWADQGLVNGEFHLA